MGKEFISIAKVIISIRHDKKLSQSQLSEKLGYKNGQFISNVERGLCSIPAKIVPILCEEYNVPKQRIVNAMIEDYEHNLNIAVGIH